MGKQKKIKEFVACQERLAKKLARKLGINNYKIYYVEYCPSMVQDLETGKWTLQNKQERIFSNSKIKWGRKRRVEVHISLAGNVEPKHDKAINKIMKRFYTRDENIIIYSVVPFC